MRIVGYWYDVFLNDDQEPYNRDEYLTKEQARGLANGLCDAGWSVCVVKMVEDAEGFVKESWRGYWPLCGNMK